jgi:hypothetical protein
MLRQNAAGMRVGVSELRGDLSTVLKYGMHVVDAHDQVIGTILQVRRHEFVLHQDVGISQTVALPFVAVSGIVASMVFLNLTPGEITYFGKVIERRERLAERTSLKPRIASRSLIPEPAL